MQQSVYSNEEWVGLVNSAIRFLRMHAEADGTFIGSLKDAMSEFISREFPDAKIEGPSLAATLPLTGLVSNDGRSQGHTIWTIAKGNITVDDWVRVTYLRRNKKQESRAMRQAGTKGIPAVPQKLSIDETLTGHPEVIASPERDYRKELEQARARVEEEIERAGNEIKRISERARTAEEKLEVANNLLRTGMNDLKEVSRLRSILRSIASDPIAYEAFRAGLELGSNESERG